jgi:intracellular septation protein
MAFLVESLFARATAGAARAALRPPRRVRCRTRTGGKPALKLIFDLMPVIVFFGAFRLAKAAPETAAALLAAVLGPLGLSAGISGGDAGSTAPDLPAVLAATACAIVATLIQVGWLLTRRLPIKPAVWISAVLIVVFGGLTIWLHNEWFIKWKPTLLYWAFSAILGGGQWLWRRNLLGALLSSELDLPTPVWDRLLVAWTAFFAALGAANLAVAYSVSTEVWVNFKTFGLLGLTLAFSIGTGVYISRFWKEQAPDA